MIAGMLGDLRHALRQLLKRPGFAAVAIVTLALGIGANTAIFSVVNSVLLRPLPVDEPERIVMVWESNLSRGWPRFSASPANYMDWVEQNDVFDHVGAYSNASVTLTGNGDPERLPGTYAWASVFSAVNAENQRILLSLRFSAPPRTLRLILPFLRYLGNPCVPAAQPQTDSLAALAGCSPRSK